MRRGIRICLFRVQRERHILLSGPSHSSSLSDTFFGITTDMMMQDYARHCNECTHDRRVRREDAARESQSVLQSLQDLRLSGSPGNVPMDSASVEETGDAECDYVVRGLYAGPRDCEYRLP